MGTLRNFSARIGALAEKVEGAGTLAQRTVAIAIVQPLVMSTPVGNSALWADPRPPYPGYVGGRARGNWHVTVGAGDEKTTNDVDAGGGRTIAAARESIEQSTPRQSIYIQNNLPYIVPLNDGHSRQAPAGFVENAVEAGIQKARSLKVLG